MSLPTDITHPRSPRSRLGMLVAALALTGTLSACSGAGDTTCSEFGDLSDDEKSDLVADLIDQSDDDAAKDNFEDLNDEDREAFLAQYSQLIAGECDSRGGDTEVGDIVYTEE